MATDFTQDSVLRFILSRGGSVRNSDLLLHFRPFLREHEEQVRNRELFKKFVNSVATVKQEDGASHVVLRKKFRGSAPSGGGTFTSGTVAGRTAQPSPEKATSNPVWGTERARQKEATTPALPAEIGMKNVLPAAGIILNNNNNVQTNLNLTPTAVCQPQISPQTPTRAQSPPDPHSINQYPHVGPQKVGSAPSLGVPTASFQNVQKPEPGLHQGPSLPQPLRTRHRQSYKTAVSCDDEDEDIQMTPGGHLGSITIKPVAASSPERLIPKINVENVERGKMLPSQSGKEPRGHFAGLPVEAMPSRRSLPAELVLEEGRFSEPGQERAWMSSSHNSIFSPSSDTVLSCSDWSLSGPRGSDWNCSSEKQEVVTGDPVRTIKREVPQRANETTKLGSIVHHADSWHRSTGDLYDDAESSDGSVSSPTSRQRPTLSKRVRKHLQGRMCRSMGADLDHLIQEEAARGRAGGNEAARLNRLHRISSSLSLHYNLSTSSLSSCSMHSRCNSLSDLAEGAEAVITSPSTASSTHRYSPSKKSQVPLEPREHDWLVKGASGSWPDIYSLFREDNNLLNKRDFISGLTVLHWIAKHGDHRVLNTLWYGVEKEGLTFDINARSSCGQTPLHIAAIHSHKNIIRLLVSKFQADVQLRDTAGKKPWQYLGQNAPTDIMHMLGAPATMRGEGEAASADHSGERRPHPRRHRPHLLSSASPGERTRTVKVKRSSSIAAFLKHKSLSRFHGYKSDG
ncbi:ankyrin repeat domain-containing protein SOWAHB-like [Nerophis lumbriciformis]|uniref:ankyrin repeat domain-containing protein SOWAHB-like n=1 Tax=Nerophis lumbriciformis TaxID=546530 RepID=UPI003BAA5998